MQKTFVLLTVPFIMFSLIDAAAEVADVSPITFGVCSRQGRRSSMEDTDIALFPFSQNSSQGFFAVYDGHGGSKIAHILANGLPRHEQSESAETVDQFFEDLDTHFTINPEDYSPRAAEEEIKKIEPVVILPLHELFAQLLTAYKGKPIISFKETFRLTEAQIFERTTTDSGSTAVAAFIDLKKKILTLANLGDSRAVFVQGSKIFATTDHKPDTPKESERIEKQGGWIGYPYGKMSAAGRKHPAYLNNSLAISRAFGNYKFEFRPHQEDSTRSFAYRTKLKALSTEPDIFQVNLTDEPSFLILACDGVWDVYSNEEAAGIVAQALKDAPDLLIEEHTPSSPGRSEIRHSRGSSLPAEYAARSLRDAAYKKGSRDNITVLVALLTKATELFPIKFITGELPIIGSSLHEEQESDMHP